MHCRSCTRLSISEVDEPSAKFEAFRSTALARFSSDIRVEPLFRPASIFPSRSKAKMSVTGSLEAPCIGILDNELKGRELLDCPLHLPVINRTLEEIRELIPRFKLVPYDIETRKGELKGLILKSSADGKQLIVRFVLRSTEAVERLRKAAKELVLSIPEICSVSANIQPTPHAILEGEQEIQISGEGTLWDRIADTWLAFKPQSFSQVSAETADALYRYVGNILKRAQATSVLDLFCGVGGFSFQAAQSARTVVGVELSTQAIECARLGMKKNELNNISFQAQSVEDFIRSVPSNFDTIITNPPRRGLGSTLVQDLLRLRPQRILYSSCNPETLFRDLDGLNGYELKSLAPFEMFPLTEHLEVVAEVERK